MSKLTRRLVLAGLLSTSTVPALALAPTRSLKPIARQGKRKVVPLSIAIRVQQAGFSGDVSIQLRDVQTGKVLDQLNAKKQLPPASVTKAVTALYAVRNLGSEASFSTRVYIDGTIIDGRLNGDIYLVGGGSPTLDTDDLFKVANELAKKGLVQVKGRFYVVDTALPRLENIDAGQPDHVGYNPAISGLNLNFNRVYFEWTRQDTGYQISLEARGRTASPTISNIRMGISDRSQPVFNYSKKSGRDSWTVAKPALGKGGSRWIPVRQPALYTGEVFQKLCRQFGILLPQAKLVKSHKGKMLSGNSSRKVSSLSRSMLKYSTNLTAEVLGLHASQKRSNKQRSLKSSAGLMANWARSKYKLNDPKFVDHSGLGDRSRLSSADMTQVLVSEGWNGALRPLLKNIALRDQQGRIIRRNDIQIVAKTGTLNFASALSGYIKTSSGRQLAFTIFSADLQKRRAISKRDREKPRGGKEWTRRARRLQQALLRDWADLA